MIEVPGAQASPVKPGATRSSEAPAKPPADAGRVQAPAASKASEQRPEQAPQPLATAPEAAASEEGAEEEAVTAHGKPKHSFPLVFPVERVNRLHIRKSHRHSGRGPIPNENRRAAISSAPH